MRKRQWRRTAEMGKNVVAKQPEECGWTTGRSIRRNQLE